MLSGPELAQSRAARGAPTALWLLGTLLLLAGACTSPERPYGPQAGSGGASGGGTPTTVSSGGNGGHGGATSTTTSTGGGGQGGTGGGGGAPLGAACTGNGECASGACADGVCCDTACTGGCMACAEPLTGVASGTCSPVKKGTDPRSSCDDEGAASCGRDGTCDGQGMCALYAAGAECAPPSCTASVKTLARTCDGSGTCVDNGTESCGAFQCMGNVCANDCQSDASCVAGQYCDTGSGNCVAKKANGAACQNGKDNECTSGHCVDGVCCNTACNAPCQACKAALNGGVDGTCGDAPAGTDPDGDCADQGAATCGLDGACDGKGACRKYQAGTPCAAGSCTNGVATNPSTCNGTGTCAGNGTTNCAPYLCAGNVCATSCATDAQCVTGSFCMGGTCTGKLPAGSACTAANQCSSGFCVDGFCCNTACNGLCQACSTAKKGSGANGSCGAINAGIDPDGECNDQGAATCGTNGSCDGAGACQRYAMGTQCAASTCSGSTQTNAKLCDGMGTCVTGGTSNCSPYVCGAAACKTSCAGDADCVAGNYCSGNACVAKKTNGTACGAASECSSGFCVDGFCCNTACTGLCQACSAAKKGTGSNGSCGSIIAGTDPDNECTASAASTCGNDGMCDGAGACRKWSSGTVCVAGSCSGSTQQNPDTCNGSGTCVDGGTTNCSPYVCGTTACKTSCTADTDCVSGLICSSGACISKKPNGATCTSATQCTSGFCVDGYCCNTSCSGTCNTCDGSSSLGGAPGTCTNYALVDCVSCGANRLCSNGACVTSLCP